MWTNAASTAGIFLLILLCLLQLLPPFQHVAAVPEGERAAAALLLDFFTSTNGNGWNLDSDSCTTVANPSNGMNRRTLWSAANTSNNSVCSWFGVACDGNNNMIITLSLRSCGLSGTLPQSLSLSSSAASSGTKSLMLNWFDVSNNAIGGTLPSSYSLWGSSITFFHVTNNMLIGSLPPSYSAWSAMTDFSASENRLTGTLPSEYKSWTKVIVFAVYQNALSGSLPPEFSSWTSLEILLVSVNSLTGTLPSTYSLLSSLTRFEFYTNSISGTLPPVYIACTKLQLLIGFSNALSGSLPSEWSTLRQLQSLHLDFNMLSGSVPTDYFSAGGLCSSLLLFSVRNNQLSGTFPLASVVQNCPNLTQLILVVNQFSGILFSSDFPNCPTANNLLAKLAYFDVGMNSFSGSVPSNLDTCFPAMSVFSLWSNSFSGAAPLSPVVRWENISIVRLDGNQFTGNLLEIDNAAKSLSTAWQCKLTAFNIWDSIGMTGSLPEYFANCTNMTYFVVQNLTLTGTLHESYATSWAAAIQNFSIRGTGLSGTIPAAVATWANLLFFDVSINNFTGSLTFASQWRKVEFLRLAMNRFFGTLPQVLKLNTNLTSFYIQTNNFTGTLDPEYATSWPFISSLYVHENQLYGTLPNSYSAWKGLQNLYFYSNDFEGTLPAQWSSWGVSVLEIKLQANRLSGTLPPQWATWTNIVTFMVHANSLAGALPASYKAFTSVETLLFDYNAFNGPLPTDWSTLTKAAVMSFTHNNLSGTIPLSWEALNLQFIGFQNNSLLSGPVLTPRVKPVFWAMSICGTGLYGSASATGAYCFPCLPGELNTATRMSAIIQLFGSCEPGGGGQTQAPSSGTVNHTSPAPTAGLLTAAPATSSTRDATGVSIIGGAGVVAILGGDPASAQMLVTLLMSSCMCGYSGDGGALSSGGSDDGVFATIVSSLTLSPFSSLGNAAMAFGNGVLMFALVGLHALLVVLLGRCKERQDRRHPHADNNNAWRALCARPEASAAKFPNICVTCGLFLVPGVVRGSVMVLGTSSSSTLEMVAAVVSALLLCLYFVLVLEWLIYRVLILDDISSYSSGFCILRRVALLHFEPFAIENPYSPPLPRPVAAYALGRGGVWSPSERRNSFGKLVAPLSPGHVRWWVVTPLLTVLTVLLSSVPTTSTTGCDALQGTVTAVTVVAAGVFGVVRPYRAVLVSLVASFSLLVVATTSVLGLLCRHDAMSVVQVLSVCSTLSYVSLVGKVYVAVLPFVEQHLLIQLYEPSRHRSGRRKELRRVLRSGSEETRCNVDETLLVPPTGTAEQRRKRKTVVMHRHADDIQLSLQHLVESICRTRSPIMGTTFCNVKLS
ncbi:GP46-like surface antigen, putative [Bodo saltans]|uniref:GP46-like surface antigen, putative n=1 Tax=Bodo saltans TaxID=75058 RepID=A0A0S4J9S4_BODSA|nr:GP46-like surface antigen, putative [Bodo saltans]|eukprot:CUG86669.1 GP46-like surface antigen, putative [Bodo saltans]